MEEGLSEAGPGYLGTCTSSGPNSKQEAGERGTKALWESPRPPEEVGSGHSEAGPGRWTRKGVQVGGAAGTKARKCELIGRCVPKQTSSDAARPCFTGSGDIGKSQE